jgi:hypothetical protein
MMKPGYIISLPERLLRALAAGLGGAVYELSLLVLPEWARRSRFYQATVARLLRIVVELVGGVPGTFPAEGMSVRQLATRKAAGNAIEMVSFVAVGWSPVWLLAAAADVVGGTQVYLRLLVEDLKGAGALSPDTEVDSVGELLTMLEHSLGQAADTVDMPPLNLQDMRHRGGNCNVMLANCPAREGWRVSIRTSRRSPTRKDSLSTLPRR